VLVLVLLAIGSYLLTLGNGKFSAIVLLGSTIRELVLPASPLSGQSTGRTNILLLGMTQDGLRTDAIILASYYWPEKKLVTINIPRDLYINDGYQQTKMGEVYAHAKSRQPANRTYPDDYTASVVGREYGIPIDYWAEINMQGAVDFINTIGGVNITVANAFTDYQYPNNNYSGYIRPAPHFASGPQHMDGNTALIFARSRHSPDHGEGSDFARSKRQALIIQGVLDRLKSRGQVANLASISGYLDILGSNITTNITSDDMVSFAKTLRKLDPNQDYLKASWASGNGFLCDATTSSGAYVVTYGAPGTCGRDGTVGATTNNDAIAGNAATLQYREQARAYVQDLLSRASPPQP
jgi:LCP family protein required for cell wall assembly